MLDIKLIRQNPEFVVGNLKKRGIDINMEELQNIDKNQREFQVKIDGLRQKRNTNSQLIGQMKKQGENTDSLAFTTKQLGEEIKTLEEEMNKLDEQRQTYLLAFPNLLDESVPYGEGEEDNPEIRKWGEPRQFSFKPKAHEEIGEILDIMDFERAARLAGSRFVLMKGWGATLERALISFMLDLHITKHGYTEYLPPFIVNRETMTANGNLPKFEEDLFHISKTDYYLIPTAEVPLTNIYRTEILEKTDLPKYLTAYTPCFRSEAGSAGKDTRGIMRLHQFSKVELVKIVEPPSSFDELEKMTKDAEEVLQLLELPYRVILLCSKDTGPNSAKTYDMEVWFPSQGKYREISSCSNCTDFQARRGALRYRPAPKANTEFPHTLNGSGVAVGRALAALTENHQQEDGSIYVPLALRPYLYGKEFLTRE